MIQNYAPDLAELGRRYRLQSPARSWQEVVVLYRLKTLRSYTSSFRNSWPSRDDWPCEVAQSECAYNPALEYDFEAICNDL